MIKIKLNLQKYLILINFLIFVIFYHSVLSHITRLKRNETDCVVHIDWSLLLPFDSINEEFIIPEVLDKNPVILSTHVRQRKGLELPESNKSQLAIKSGWKSGCLVFYLIPDSDRMSFREDTSEWVKSSGFAQNEHPFFFIYFDMILKYELSALWGRSQYDTFFHSKVILSFYEISNGCLMTTNDKAYYVWTPLHNWPSRMYFLIETESLQELNKFYLNVTSVLPGGWGYSPGIYDPRDNLLRERDTRAWFKDWGLGPAYLIAAGIVSKILDFDFQERIYSDPHLKICFTCTLSKIPSREFPRKSARVILNEVTTYHLIYCKKVLNYEQTKAFHIILRPFHYDIWISVIITAIFVGLLYKNISMCFQVFWSFLNQPFPSITIKSYWSSSNKVDGKNRSYFIMVVAAGMFTLQTFYSGDVTGNLIVPSVTIGVETAKELVDQGFVYFLSDWMDKYRKEKSHSYNGWNSLNFELNHVNMTNVTVKSFQLACKDSKPYGMKDFQNCTVARAGEVAFLENINYVEYRITEMRAIDPKVHCGYVKQPWMTLWAPWIFQSHGSERVYSIIQKSLAGGVIQRWEMAYRVGTKRKQKRDEAKWSSVWIHMFGGEPLTLGGPLRAIFEIWGVFISSSVVMFALERIPKSSLSLWIKWKFYAFGPRSCFKT